MKTKPILFSPEMVLANLEGRKSQTRRVINEIHYGFLEYAFKNKKNLAYWISKNAKYKMGDTLWVRETSWFDPFQQVYHYKADEDSCMKLFTGWKPSIHMPKEAARMFLKILSVKVERLQDISESDCIAEGIERDKNAWMPTPDKFWDVKKDKLWNSAKDAFKSLWENINGKKIPWVKNPFVFVYEYELTEKPLNFLKED